MGFERDSGVPDVPLFLVADEPTRLPAPGGFRLAGLRGGRATRAGRLRPGDEVRLGDGRGGVADARVTSLGRDHLDLTVGVGTHLPRQTPGIAVVQRLDSPEADALAVAELTELGAAEISALAAPEVLGQVEARRGARVARWRKTALEAAERAGRVWLPRVGSVFGEDALQRRFDWGASGLVLDRDSVAKLSTVDMMELGELVVVVGEETRLDGHVRRVRLDEHAPDPRAAAVAAMTVLAAKLGR